MYGVPAVHSHTVKVEYTLICISMQSERRRRRPRWATNLFRDSRFIVSAPRSGARGSRPLRVVRDARSGVHQGAESFAGLEPRDLLRGNGHRGACFGVATQPWPARAHPKAPKPAQFDVVPRLLRSSQGCTLSTSLEEVHDHDNKASKNYSSHWFV
jgi:hypothetical protein